MELTLCPRPGYVLPTRNKAAQTVINLVPVDSIYTQVRRSSYTVGNTRVGDLYRL